MIPEDLDREIFDTLIQSDNIKIERIVSRGHTSPDRGWYDLDANEWVMVLKGEAIITLGDLEEFHLKSGSYLDIPAHTKHKVTWTKPDTDTIWLAVHY